jgi:hypothetical protein
MIEAMEYLTALRFAPMGDGWQAGERIITLGLAARAGEVTRHDGWTTRHDFDTQGG